MDTRVETRLRTEAVTPTMAPPPELPVRVSEAAPDADPEAVDRAIPVPTLITAELTWAAGVFLLCYGAIPWVVAMVGLSLAPISQLGSEMLGVGSALGLLLCITAVFRPSVRVRDVRVARIMGATAAMLSTWAVLHTVLPGLSRFSDMGIVELPLWLIWNGLEAALWGAMIASVAKTAFRAYALAAMFEIVLMVVTWLGLTISAWLQ